MNRPAALVARPDRWQVSAMTGLLGLAFAPLLLRLELQVGALVGLLFALRVAAIVRPAIAPGKWSLAVLTLLGVVNVLDAYHRLTGQAAGTALLLTMIALKLLEVRTNRDLRVLTLLFGFLLVAQFLFDSSAWLAAYLLLLLIANVALMADLSLGATKERIHHRTRVALTLTLQAVPLALVLFLFFPRLDAPLWDLGVDSKRVVAGIKDWLEPGSISELVVSGEDAFHARFDKPLDIASERLYWRGPVLWQTDGRRWDPAPRGALTEGAGALEVLGERISYSVALEPTDQSWLFALDLPVLVPSDATVGPDFQVTAGKPIKDLRLYRVTSAPVYRALGLSPGEEALARQLPANVTRRMQELVTQWKRGAADAQTVVDRALQHFHRQPFRYTLLPPALGENPMDRFLFETRAGFCEHYAGAFTLLMRIAGIPSRIVLGYLGGQYNPISNQYLIRQSDAHAWSEVWISGSGWVRVDPTAAVDPTRVEHDGRLASLGAGAPVRFRIARESVFGRLLDELRLVADAIDSGWTDWVVGLSVARQLELLRSLGLGHLRQYGLAVVMVSAGAAVLLLWSTWLSRSPGSADPVVQAYERLCRKLAGIGLVRRPGEGPLDYLRRAEQQRPDLAATIRAFRRRYIPLRYGATGPVGNGPRLLQRLVRGFKPKGLRGTTDNSASRKR